MSIQAGALRMGRRLANSTFTETVIVGRFEEQTDPSTGDAVKALVGDPTYSGPGRIKYPSLAVNSTVSASQPMGEQLPVLKVPSGSAVAARGEEVHVTASTVDDGLVGRVYRINGNPQLGQTTAHRYPLEDLS